MRKHIRRFGVKESYPNISVEPRISSTDDPAFSVEVRHDNEGDWETWYNGVDQAMAIEIINQLLKQYPDYPLYINSRDVSGYLFKVQHEENLERFFRGVDTVRNPFYNRRIYAKNNPDATVSFNGLNI